MSGYRCFPDMAQSFLDTTTHNISWINKRDLDDELVIRPAFQRNPVWTNKQKAFLIDTILHGYPIPELYIQEYSDEDGNDQYVVVDGQQRIRACLGFIAGEFGLFEEDSPEFADMYFEDLSTEQKKQSITIILWCESYRKCRNQIYVRCSYA